MTAVLLRAVLGTLMGLLPAALFAAVDERARSDWYYFAGMGLFLGGLGGLTSLVEASAARRGLEGQLWRAAAVTLAATVWGLAAILQAEWTRDVVTHGSFEAGCVRIEAASREILYRGNLEFVASVLFPLGVMIGGTTLARARAWPRWGQAAMGVSPLLLAALLARPKWRWLLFVFGGALVVTHLGAAWLAGALARRWWPQSSEADHTSTSPPG